jgi:hypothetical protein
MSDIVFVPLTDLRRGVLGLIGQREFPRGKYPGVVSWGRRFGFIRPDLLRLTPFGEIALQLDEAHQPHIHRRQLGMTPVRPQRPVYGVSLRCRCGFNWKTNEGGAEGRKEARAAFSAHYAEEGERRVTRLLAEHAITAP